MAVVHVYKVLILTFSWVYLLCGHRLSYANKNYRLLKQKMIFLDVLDL